MSLKEEGTATETTGGPRARVITAVDVRMDHTHPELQEQIDDLRLTLERLMLQVNELRKMVLSSPMRVRVVEINEVSIEEAKKSILEYMRTSDDSYPDDIADELGFDLKVTMEAVDQLIKEGKIKEKEKV